MTKERLTSEQIAAIRARAAEGVQFSAVQDRAALLAHIDATDAMMHGLALSHERAAQAEAALQTEREKGERVFQAVVYAFEGQDEQVPDDLREHGMVRRARKFRAQQGERIARLVSALTAVRDAARQRYPPRDIQLITENALAASSAEPPTLEKGWLVRSIAAAERDIKELPDWLRSGAQDEKENTK